MGKASKTDTVVDAIAPTRLERPAVGDPVGRAVARAQAEAALFGDAAPVTLGRYRVIERAGSGGMGVVWSAWDPELGRGVALKLASAGDTDARRRARDEGRALAKLSHPNVVPIYDVIEHEAGVMLVMELVKGETLRQVAARKPPPAELVRAYRQAGEGLAAAHHARLVHRDFKPDNAILAEDGRVRVLDFGLAHQVQPADARPDEIAGTPRYMAPEQRAGDAVTPAVDQYALCVSLEEALAAQGPLPRWVAPILARGAAERPGDRFESMDELLRALALDPATRRRRRRVAVAAGVVAAGGIAAAFVAGRAAQEESPCEGGPALIAPSWTDRRPAVAAHLGGLGTPYAAEAAPRLLAALDGYAAAWVDLHRASCRAHRRGELTAELLDRRTACLARRRTALAAVADVAGGVAADALPDLVVAAGALPAVSACADDDALLAAVSPPPPEARPEADAIADLVVRADVARDAGRYDEAAVHAGAAVERAHALGYRPLVARALLARGRIALYLDQDLDRGAADFSTAAREATAVGDDPLAVEAFARQAWALATTGDPTRALDGLALIEAMAERAGAQATFARALLDLNVGGVALARSDRDAARGSFERARDGARNLEGAGAIELTAALISLMIVTDDAAARDAIAAELIATRTRLLGARHPRTLIARTTAILLGEDLDRTRADLRAPCHDLAAFHPGLGQMIGECAHELLLAALASGDPGGAADAAALVLASDGRGAGASQIAAARAADLLTRGEPAEAARIARTARASRADPDAPWYLQLPAADLTLIAGLALTAAGDGDGARAELADAAGRYEALAHALPAPVQARRRALLARARAAAAP